MFKKTKIKQVMKRSLASVLAVATVFSGLVVPEKAEAFTSSPSDRRICYIDLGFTPSTQNGGWNTTPSWIAAIDYYSGNKFTLAGHSSDYTNGSNPTSIWTHADKVLYNHIDGIYTQYGKCPSSSCKYAPLFFRNGYRFKGWDIYDESGAFKGGASNWNGATEGDYSSATGNAQNEAFVYHSSNYTLKAVWESIGYNCSSAGTIKPVTVGGSTVTVSGKTVSNDLDPTYGIQYTKGAGSCLLSVGEGVVRDLESDSDAFGLTTYTENIGKASAFDDAYYTLMDNNGQWTTNEDIGKVSITVNPNGGSTTFCGATRTSATTAYRLADLDGGAIAVYPSSKSGYTFTGYTTSNGKSVTPSSSGTILTYGSSNITLTAQYTQNMSISASDYTGTYDGNSHTISLSGVPSGATVTYSTDGSNYSSTKPTRTNVGSTTVYWKATKSGMTTKTGTNTITVNRASNGASATGYEGTYDEQTHNAVSVSGVPSGSTVTYTLNGASTGSSVPRIQNAGTYTIGYSIANPNYVTKSGTVTAMIRKSNAAVVSAKDSEVLADGKSYSIQTPVVTKPKNVTITYSKTSDGEFSKDKPVYSQPGTYTTYWKIKDNDGNYNEVSGHSTLTIKPVYDYDATTGKLSIYNTTEDALNIIYSNTSAMNAKSIVVKEGAEAGQIGFDRFDYLEGVYIDGKNDAYSSRDGLLYSADGTVLKYCPKAYRETEVVLPYSTAKVEPGVFSGRNNVERVLVKNPNCDITDAMGNVRVIAFKDSSVLTYCQDEGIAWDYIDEIGENFFKNEASITSFTVPDNITTIGRNAFSGCSSLKDVNLGQVETIGVGAFKNSGLTSVAIPSTVKTIDSEAFAYDQALENVTFAENSQIKTIGKDAFIGCGVSEISIPNSVESVGAGAFKNTQLGTISIEGMNTELLWDANDVILPADAKIECYYGSKAYDFAKEHDYSILLKVGYDKDGVTSYSRDEDAVSLIESVSVGPNLTAIENSAFQNGSLENIVFDENSQVASIGSGAFAGTKLVDVTLPEATTSLGKAAFAGIDSLKSVSLGGVTDIPEQAFKGDFALSTVTDSTKITSIGAEAFYHTNIGDADGVFYTGDKLKSIGMDAFSESTIQKLVVENPNTVFPDGKIVPDSAKIQGYTNSSADVYSQTYYNKSCESLGKPAYVITFDTVGGVGGTQSIYAVNGKELPSIETPSREDYVFSGYYASTNGGGTQYFDADGTPLVKWTNTSNATLYASWKHETFNIAYDANCDIAEGTMDNDVVNTKSDYVLSKNTYICDGYEFAGWALTKDAKTPKYADRENVRFSAKAGETVTLYAVWKPTFYTIKYNGNGGIDANSEMSDQTLKADKKGNLRENKFKKAGYTFLGWSEDSEATVATWYDKEPVIHLADAGKTITLYAIWAKDNVKQYTITFDANGGSLDETTAPIYEGYETRIPDTGAKRDGFTFAGWSVVKASGKVDYRTGDMITADKDITLYAVWETRGDTGYKVRVSTQKTNETYDVSERTMSANVGDIVTLTEGVDFIVPDGFYIDETSSVLSQTIAENTIFNITLNREKVSVVFDLNANDAVMRNVPVIKGLWGQRVTVVSEMPERAGYTFKGWSLGKEDTTPVTEVTLAVGGTTVYAIWAKEGNEESKPSATPVPSETPSLSETPIATATPDSSSEPNPDATPAPTLTPDGSVIGEPTPTPSSAQEGDNSGNLGVATPLPNNGTNGTDGGTGYSVVGKVELTNTTPKTDNLTTATLGKVVYKISGKTAMVQKVSSKKVKAITIRNTVKINGKTLKVTKINKNAFKGCKKLKKVTIQAKSLKSIGKNAFKGIAKKAVIKVPKAKKKAYKKLLKKAKIAKTIRVK